MIIDYDKIEGVDHYTLRIHPSEVEHLVRCNTVLNGLTGIAKNRISFEVDEHPSNTPPVPLSFQGGEGGYNAMFLPTLSHLPEHPTPAEIGRYTGRLKSVLAEIGSKKIPLRSLFHPNERDLGYVIIKLEEE